MMIRNFFCRAAYPRFSLFKTFTRNLFIVSLEYKVPLEKVEEHISAHRAFLEKCYKNNTFIASGRKVPRTGGIIIASTKDKDTLESLLEKDPFKQNGIADYQITEFIPAMHSDNFLKIAEDDRKIKDGKKYSY